MATHRLVNMVQLGATAVVTLRCPHCSHTGAMAGVLNSTDVQWIETVQPPPPAAARQVIFAAGVRVCPNPDCCSLVHVVLCQGRLIETFPPQVIDFDSTNLPLPILSSLEEAIKAHAAGCYRASALMVRRVLEELCDDKQATGPDLKARLGALGKSIVVPTELLDAADELRLLGNDAAHITAKNYDQLGDEQVSLAIELAKELLKAVYQYTSLVGKLKALKKP